MTITAFTGPVVTFPDSNAPGAAAGANPEAGPSLFDHGLGLIDSRYPFTYKPGSDFGAPTKGFLSTTVFVIDQVPSALAVANIAASQAPTTAVALTLVTSTAAGITVGASVVNAATGQTVTGLLVIDTAMGSVTFGSAKTISLWNPATAVARNIRVTSNGTDTSGAFLVSGYDIYGYQMSESITGSAGGVASGKKAFKYITSVTPTGTIASTLVSVGTGDVYGLPVCATNVAYVNFWWNSAQIVTGTTFVAADTTSPATSTTGDVRGTILVPNASDGTKKLTVQVTVTPAEATTTVTIFGVIPA